MKPKILLATTTRWASPARLAIAWAKAGCDVESVFPPGNLLEKTRVVRRTYPYHAMTPLRSFAAAIDASKPDLVIPGEDLAALHLHDIYELEQRRGQPGLQTRALIERSVGAATGFSIVFARTALMELARKEGALVPATQVVETVEDLRCALDKIGLPLVLKADATSGGFGVRIASTAIEAQKAMKETQAPPRATRVLKSAIASSDYTLLRPFILRKRSVVNAQQFIAGSEATSAVACWQGRVLASLHFAVVQRQYALGPSTVLKLIEHPDMTSTEEKVVRKLKLSGLHGFDYILEEKTGRAYLIELNPRATQVCHLAMGSGRDLVEALYAVLSSSAVRDTAPVTEKDTVALFPHELKRDSKSEYLSFAYHDIPTEEPCLVEACMTRLPQNRSWAASNRWLRSLMGVSRTKYTDA